MLLYPSQNAPPSTWKAFIPTLEYIYDDEIIEILHIMPSLVEFDIGDAGGTRPVAPDELAYHGDELIPNLEVLTVRVDSGIDPYTHYEMHLEQPDTVLHMLERRRASLTSELKRANLVLWRPISEITHARSERLRTTGFIIELVVCGVQ